MFLLLLVAVLALVGGLLHCRVRNLERGMSVLRSSAARADASQESSGPTPRASSEVVTETRRVRVVEEREAPEPEGSAEETREPTPEEVRAQREAWRRDADEAFQSQPRDAAWARGAERDVGEAIRLAAEGQGVEIPIDRLECRSTWCVVDVAAPVEPNPDFQEAVMHAMLATTARLHDGHGEVLSSRMAGRVYLNFRERDAPGMAGDPPAEE